MPEKKNETKKNETKKAPKNLPTLGSPPKGVSKSSKDLLSFYLAQVRKYPLLEPEEEKEYAIKFKESGDREAAEKLVTSNLRLVIKIAFQYHRQWANVLDLIQEGNVGLVEALSRYDPYREVRFSSYAQYWIRAMILRFLLDNFRLVKFGNTRAGRKLFFQLQKEKDRLESAGIDPTPKRIAQNLGVSEKEVNLVDRHMRAPALSLDTPTGDDPDGRTLSEVVPSQEPTDDPEMNAARSELGDLVHAKLDEFEKGLDDDRERDIWLKRMRSDDPDSLASLGRDWGVSKERIRQVEARMKKRLKSYLESELGEELDFEFDTPTN